MWWVLKTTVDWFNSVVIKDLIPIFYSDIYSQQDIIDNPGCIAQVFLPWHIYELLSLMAYGVLQLQIPCVIIIEYYNLLLLTADISGDKGQKQNLISFKHFRQSPPPPHSLYFLNIKWILKTNWRYRSNY